MIRFFRQLRKGFVNQEQITKYLLYALGEIALVVIGILIALQINIANEHQKDLQKEQVYLKALKAELMRDTARIQRTKRALSRMKSATRYILDVYEDPEHVIQDSIHFIGQYKLMVAFDLDLPEPMVWGELQSTGNLSLIRDRRILDGLYAYYDTMNSVARDYENNTQYFVNRGRYYDSATMSSQHQEEFFENFSVDYPPTYEEVQTIINNEGNFKNSKGIYTGLLLSNNSLQRLNNLVLKNLKIVEENM